ncbi:MAG: hypothetical protein H0X62_02390 [Bacteroidetes bacterium]|nr:hypothetical protein [Bacteroidota bacterium]
MKKLIIIFLVPALLSIQAIAQNPEGEQLGKREHNKHQHEQLSPDQRAHNKVDRLSKEITLSDEQKQMLTTVFVNSQQEMMAAKESANHDKKQAIKQRKDENVKQVLGDDAKYQQYLELNKNHKNKHKKGDAEKGHEQKRKPENKTK